MPEPSGSHAAPRSGPWLSVSRAGGPTSNGTSVPGAVVLKGSVCPHPMDARSRSHARSLPGSCCTVSHRHVSLVCQKGLDVRIGDADAGQHRTGLQVFNSGKEQSHERTDVRPICWSDGESSYFEKRIYESRPPGMELSYGARK